MTALPTRVRLTAIPAVLALLLTGCAPQQEFFASTPEPVLSPAGGREPVSGPRQAAERATVCARFATILLGGRPAEEDESAPLVRAAAYASEAFARLLRTGVPTGATWQDWKAQGVTDLAVTLDSLAGRDVPPAGSRYVAYTAERIPRRDGPALASTRWTVTCTTTHAGSGWLVSAVDVQPQPDPALR